MRLGLGFGIDVNSVVLWHGADVSFNGPMLALPASLQRLGFTYTRNSAKTVYQNNALVTLAANQFGTTYDAVTGLHAYEPEPEATNLATNSAGAAATWTVSNVTDAGTPIAGFSNSLQFGDNSVLRTAKKIVSVTNTVKYCASIFIEMDDGGAPVIGSSTTTGDMCIVLSAGGVFSLDLVTTRIGTGNLYRVSGTRVATSTASTEVTVAKYTTQSARTFRVIGIQVETGSRATSYIATDGSTRSRAADVLSTALTNIPGFNAAGYTMVVDGRSDVATGTLRYDASVNDGTANNFSAISRQADSTVGTETVSGGVSQAAVNEVSPGTDRRKVAYSVAANSFLRAVNGTAGTADTGGSVPVAPTTLNIGHHLGASQTNGYIYGFKLITTALNQAQTTGQTT